MIARADDDLEQHGAAAQSYKETAAQSFKHGLFFPLLFEIGQGHVDNIGGLQPDL